MHATSDARTQQLHEHVELKMQNSTHKTFIKKLSYIRTKHLHTRTRVIKCWQKMTRTGLTINSSTRIALTVHNSTPFTHTTLPSRAVVVTRMEWQPQVQIERSLVKTAADTPAALVAPHPCKVLADVCWHIQIWSLDFCSTQHLLTSSTGAFVTHISLATWLLRTRLYNARHVYR